MENRYSSLGKRTSILNNNLKEQKYIDVLNGAKAFFQSNDNYKDLILEVDKGSIEEGKKDKIKLILEKFITDNNSSVEGLTNDELLKKLYEDIVGFSFITKYLNDKNVEEININSWEDVEINYSDGSRIKAPERFINKEQALNIIRKMLNISGATIDNASPIVLGHLSKNIRIAVLKSPIVDEDVEVSASIRIVNANNLGKEDFIKNETATEEMLDFASTLLKYNTSMCIAGGTGSGKTTLTDWILETLENKRIFTIESGSREFDLVKRDKNGKIKNSVIHTITRPSENDNLSIEQEDLLAVSLRFHPDVICVGEMRDKEAFSAQEAARTGHTVITTVHSNDCRSTYKRIVSLCKKGTDIDNQTLMEFVTEAFPIVIYAKQLENKKRKITEIMECIVDEKGNVSYNTLFRYKVTENRRERDKVIIDGYFEKVNNISENMKERLLQNGMPYNELEKLLDSEVG